MQPSSSINLSDLQDKIVSYHKMQQGFLEDFYQKSKICAEITEECKKQDTKVGLLRAGMALGEAINNATKSKGKVDDVGFTMAVGALMYEYLENKGDIYALAKRVESEPQNQKAYAERALVIFKLHKPAACKEPSAQEIVDIYAKLKTQKKIKEEACQLGKTIYASLKDKKDKTDEDRQSYESAKKNYQDQKKIYSNLKVQAFKLEVDYMKTPGSNINSLAKQLFSTANERCEYLFAFMNRYYGSKSI